METKFKIEGFIKLRATIKNPATKVEHRIDVGLNPTHIIFYDKNNIIVTEECQRQFDKMNIVEISIVS